MLTVTPREHPWAPEKGQIADHYAEKRITSMEWNFRKSEEEYNKLLYRLDNQQAFNNRRVENYEQAIANVEAGQPRLEAAQQLRETWSTGDPIPPWSGTKRKTKVTVKTTRGS